MKLTDVLIHVHPELAAETRAKVEEDVRSRNGVVSAHFNHREHPHALVVEYDPDAVQTAAILEAVKRFDPDATMVGL